MTLSTKSKEMLLTLALASVVTAIAVRGIGVKKLAQVKKADGNATKKIDNATLVLKAYKMAKGAKEPASVMKDLQSESLSKYGMKVMLNQQKQLCVVDAEGKLIITDKS